MATFSFEAEVSLENWQIEKLERQIQEEAKKRFGEDCDVVWYGFSIKVTVKVKHRKKTKEAETNEDLISKIAKAYGVSREYVANNIDEFIQDL